MSTMSDLDLQLQEVAVAMSDQPQEVQTEYMIDSIIRELRDLPVKDRLRAIIFIMDELCALTKEQGSEIDRYMAGQIITRAQLASSFLFERAQANKVVYLR